MRMPTEILRGCVLNADAAKRNSKASRLDVTANFAGDINGKIAQDGVG